MKKLYIFALIIFAASTVNAQKHIHNKCLEGKISLNKDLFSFDESKYQEKSSFSYDVKYYRLNLLFEDINNKYVAGEITTYFKTKTSGFNQISFDLADNMSVDSIIFRQNKIPMSSITHTSDELTINLPTTIANGIIDSISVFYQGIPDPSGGFGSFIQDSHSGTPIIWTLSEPYGAKDWWPCKQSLNDKADSIDVYVTNENVYKAASNGLLISETTQSGMKTAHWKHKHPITAYLIAVAVTNYSAYSDNVILTTGQNVEVLNYVYPEDLSYAQNNTPNVLDVIQLYSDLFIPYPFYDEKYGHAQFGWGGGMEHQTMSFMVGFSHGLMAHELAHQWFGDFVTCGSWAHIWLNEGFATYLDGMTHEHNLSGGDDFDTWKSDRINVVTSQTGGSVWVNDTTNVNRIFSGRLSYYKGALVLHMLRKIVGDDAFFQGLQNYLTDPNIANGYAMTSDLQAHIEATYGSSLEYYFDDWFYGEGYPIYNITYSQNTPGNINVKINQSQSHNSVDFFEMKVPVKFHGASQDSVIWFNNTSNGQQYIVNLGFTVTSVEFDPNNDIVSTGTTVLKVGTLKDGIRFFISPNPANEEIKVNFIEKIKPEKVNIIDYTGRIIKSFEQENNASYIFKYDIKDLPRGLYFISFKQEGKTVSKKFIKN